MIRFASIYVRQGRAYIPTTAELIGEGEGILLVIEPVYSGPPTEAFIHDTLEHLHAIGHPYIQTPKMIGSAAPDSLLLKAAGVRSYRTFEQGAVQYGITWSIDEITIVTALPGGKRKRGWFGIDGPTWAFEKATPTLELVQRIVSDIGFRPEVLN